MIPGYKTYLVFKWTKQEPRSLKKSYNNENTIIFRQRDKL